MRSPALLYLISTSKKKGSFKPKRSSQNQTVFFASSQALGIKISSFFFCHPMMAIETTAKKIMSPACISKAVCKVESAHHKQNTWFNLDFKAFFFFFRGKLHISAGSGRVADCDPAGQNIDVRLCVALI